MAAHETNREEKKTIGDRRPKKRTATRLWQKGNKSNTLRVAFVDTWATFWRVNGSRGLGAI